MFHPPARSRGHPEAGAVTPVLHSLAIAAGPPVSAMTAAAPKAVYIL